MNFFQGAYSRYDAEEGLASGQIAAYSESPEAALRRLQKQYRYDFELGHVFEPILYDRARGADTFKQSYFVADLKAPPDELFEWIANGEDFDEKTSVRYIHNKGTNDLNKTYATRHEWLKRCSKNPGKLPIAQLDYEMLCRMADNLLKIVLYLPGVGEICVSDLLKESSAMWQYPLYWERAGIKKKALADIYFRYGDEVYVFDFKTTASFSRFESSLSYRYGQLGPGLVQDLHYAEGAETWHPVIFLVAEKTEDGLARAYEVEVASRYRLIPKYEDTCKRCAEWIAGGRPVKGWLDKKTIQIFVKE